MKIEKITLCNLTSLEGEQVVDFTKEPLRSAGLFAITGDTGAGKSTLLDAICLALYNKSPRFDGAEKLSRDDKASRQAAGNDALQTDDVRNLLRRGCQQAYSRVEFSIDGRRYEAGWALSLNRNGKPRPVVQTLRQLSPESREVPAEEVSKRIVELLGLDYTQFTRTVMLAQNSFANFLRAKRVDKSALLEKLTGTEIYGLISQKIYEHYAEANFLMENRSNDYRSAAARCLDEADEQRALEEQQLVDSQLKHLAEQLTDANNQLERVEQYFQALAQVRRCEEEYAAANRQYVSVHREELELERYDQVIEVQPAYQEIKVREADINDLRNQEADNARAQEKSRAVVEKRREELELAVEHDKTARETLRQRQPALKKGYALSGEIKQTERLLAQLQEESRQAALKSDELRLNLAGRQRESRDNAALVAQLEQQRQALAIHQRMFDSYELLLDKFGQLAAMADQQQRHRKQLDELQGRKRSLQVSAERMVKQRDETAARLQSLRNELKMHQEANRSHDGTELQRKVAQRQDLLRKLESARGLWQRLSGSYEEQAQRLAEQARRKMDIEQNEREINAAEVEVERRTDHFRVLERSHLLSQSKDIERLRATLKEGSPCPLCGATHHPYHTETERELGQLIDNIESDYDEAQRKLQRAVKTLASLREKQSAARSRQEAGQEYLQQLQARIEADVASWAAYADAAPSFADCSATVNRDARRVMIEQLIESTAAGLDHARQELEAYNRHQVEINRINAEAAELENRLADTRQQLANIDLAVKECALQADTLSRRLQEDERTSSEIYERIDALSTLSAWFTDWRTNRDAFRLKLANLYESWRNTTARLETARAQTSELAHAVKELTDAQATAEAQAQQLREKSAHTAEVLQDQRKALELLFGSEAPEAEAERLEKAVAQAHAAVGAAQQAYDRDNEAYQALRGTGANLTANRLKRQEEAGRKRVELDYWIQKFNADHAPLQFAELERIFADGRDWGALRRDIAERQRQLTIAANELANARRQLGDAQNKVGDSYGENTAVHDELRRRIGELEEQAATRRERAVELSNRLYAHRLGQQEAREAKERLDEATERRNEWWQLNVLLGSADGKKFRELAQGYTFQLLIDQANAQLLHLCPRYRLWAPTGSLTLEIIDRDMCDEHRYVSSLSGGETFVVSLALALGLSSMSSRNLAIGSLFIDEGFGNLDHESLDLVMDALGNLENAQGRKVGVISHTDQIRSQISPQIRLIKLPRGGQSRIEVV